MSQIPAVWKTSTIVPLLKTKNRPTHIDQYHYSIPSIRFECLLLLTLSQHLPISDIQQGPLAAVFIWKIRLCIDFEAWGKNVPLNFCIQGISFKPFLYKFEADPLRSFHGKIIQIQKHAFCDRLKGECGKNSQQIFIYIKA